MILNLLLTLSVGRAAPLDRTFQVAVGVAGHKLHQLRRLAAPDHLTPAQSAWALDVLYVLERLRAVDAQVRRMVVPPASRPTVILVRADPHPSNARVASLLTGLAQPGPHLHVARGAAGAFVRAWLADGGAAVIDADAVGPGGLRLHGLVDHVTARTLVLIVADREMKLSAEDEARVSFVVDGVTAARGCVARLSH